MTSVWGDVSRLGYPSRKEETLLSSISSSERMNYAAFLAGNRDCKAWRQAIGIGAGLQRTLDIEEKTRKMWHALNELNGLRKRAADWYDERPKYRPVSVVDSILGQEGPQWAQILPQSEEWAVSIVIWLRENGVIPSDVVEAERWKVSYLNMVPLAPSIAESFAVQSAEVVFFPTRKCLWRLIRLAHRQIRLRALNAAKDWDTTYSPTMMTKGWDQVLLGEDAPAYIKEFGCDYDSRETCVPEVENAFIYEYHYMVLKNRSDELPQEMIRSLKPTSEIGTAPKQHTVEFIKWSPIIEMVGKRQVHRIPQKCLYEAFNFETGEKDGPKDIGVGPTMFVPFEPLSAILMCTRAIESMLSKSLITLSSEMEDLMTLANCYLQLAEINKPIDMWSIPRPESYKEELPPTKGSTNVARRRDCQSFGGKVMWEEEVEDEESILVCDSTENDIFDRHSDEESDYDSHSTQSTSSSLRQRQCQDLHEVDLEVVRMLEVRMVKLCRANQIRFDEIKEKYGLTVALQHQRSPATGPDDQEMARLWGWTESIKEVIAGCRGQCLVTKKAQISRLVSDRDYDSEDEDFILEELYRAELEGKEQLQAVKTWIHRTVTAEEPNNVVHLVPDSINYLLNHPKKATTELHSDVDIVAEKLQLSAQS